MYRRSVGFAHNVSSRLAPHATLRPNLNRRAAQLGARSVGGGLTAMSISYARHGRSSVRPYLFGGTELPQFISGVFGATEVERHQLGPESFHVELSIGDSIVVVEAGPGPDGVQPTPSGDWPTVAGRDNFVAWHIRNAISAVGSLIHRPGYGAGLVGRVELPVTDTTLFLTENLLRESARRDFRTTDVSVTATVDSLNAGRLNIDLVVVPLQSKQPEQAGFQVVL